MIIGTVRIELGASCGKTKMRRSGQRTAYGNITKAKLIGRSFYGFIGLITDVSKLQFRDVSRTPDASRNNS
jgi:hypothetical protein